MYWSCNTFDPSARWGKHPKNLSRVTTSVGRRGCSMSGRRICNTFFSNNARATSQHHTLPTLYVSHLSTAYIQWACLCFLPIHSEHQVRWTYQPGSHRRKVTQDFSSTFFLRCMPYFFSREGFRHSFPSSTVKSNFVYSFSTRWAFFFFFFFLVRKIPFAGIELTSQRVRRLRSYLWATGVTG